ncbi:MAG: type II secretion system F family protein [Pseudomonadaceae bacterium]|nr:type II secretion system F family protein [Pseudomonadaceae bacterium]
MPRYLFKAKSSSGEITSGFRVGLNPGAVAQELSASGMLPLKIESAEEPENEPKKVSWLGLKPTVKTNELVVFSLQMASLTKAGISVVKAVNTLAESSKNEYFAQVLEDVANHLESGMDIASSLGRHPRVFNELFVALIHVGENTGRLDTAFRQIASYLELERETRQRIQAATRYPMFVMVAISIAIVILNMFVIPAFATVFAKYGADLPWQTQVILAVSNFFVRFWPLLLLAGIGVVWGWFAYLKTPAGRLRWHGMKIRIPVIGSIFERIYLSRFCHTFAMVSRAGVPLNQGLKIVAKAIGSDYFAQRIDGMRHGIERGESITATARQAKLFSPVVLQMMAVGEETGTMDELLDQAASFYEEEVSYALKGMTDALEPILIIGIAGLVLIMALGVFLPLWDLNSVAN